jgi:NADH:ubiquinone oxidoreductase subunit 6 (subunit J)
MTALQIAFLLTSAVTLAAATLVVMVRNLFHAALYLIVTLFGVAVLFALLDASFLVAAQVALYIGAISILIIFAVMLTQNIMRHTLPQGNQQWAPSLAVALAVFASLAFMLLRVPQFNVWPQAVPLDNSLIRLGQAMVDPNQFALVFEVASVLLLAAMVGSIMVARDRK